MPEVYFDFTTSGTDNPDDVIDGLSAAMVSAGWKLVPSGGKDHYLSTTGAANDTRCFIKLQYQDTTTFYVFGYSYFESGSPSPIVSSHVSNTADNFVDGYIDSQTFRVRGIADEYSVVFFSERTDDVSLAPRAMAFGTANRSGNFDFWTTTTAESPSGSSSRTLQVADDLTGKAYQQGLQVRLFALDQAATAEDTIFLSGTSPVTSTTVDLTSMSSFTTWPEGTILGVWPIQTYVTTGFKPGLSFNEWDCHVLSGSGLGVPGPITMYEGVHAESFSDQPGWPHMPGFTSTHHLAQLGFYAETSHPAAPIPHVRTLFGPTTNIAPNQRVRTGPSEYWITPLGNHLPHTQFAKPLFLGPFAG